MKYNSKNTLPAFLPCWERVKQSTEIKNFTQLAKIAGISQPYVSNMKKKNIFLPEWAFFIAQKYVVSMDWILTGVSGSNYDTEEGKTDVDYFLLDLREWLGSFEHDPDRKRMFEKKFSISFPEFNEWVYNQLNTRLDVDHLDNEK